MSKDGYQLCGQNIQGYKIINPIGQGKFSIVYRAENEQGIPFALKKIKIFDMGDQKQREKCLKQVDLMRPLDHPNIIKYIDSFIHNNELIIVTQWAEKGDLKKLLKQHQSDQLPFDEAVIWQYMRQISSGLQHMHQKRIMHRDLKPANIFIAADNSLKVGDLGLGRIFGSQTLQAYSKVGTPLYMSPQLIKDTGYNMNADVWSLGCICYQLAELNSPFRNKQQKMSLMELFDNITKCNYKPISSRYSPELSRVIRDMIVVDPNKRLNSEQVLQIAVYNIKNSKKSKLDPYIAMQDIHTKLHLLQFTTMFCPAAQRKPIHRFYFAIQDNNCPQYDQLFYFIELCYWIMGLAKAKQKKQKLPIYTKTLIDWKSPDNACRKLFSDLNSVGIKFEDIQVESIRHGYGQSVCFLLNQVLNRELVRSNFQFGIPKHQNYNISEQQCQELAGDSQMNEQLEKQQKNGIEQQQMEEQSQFEQSIFYRKDKRERVGDAKLLEKIQEFDDEQDHAIIYGKVDEKQWRIQCARIDKKFAEITQSAKEARKKHGYHNFQTTKQCSIKLSDLTKYVKPATSTLCHRIEQDLEKIQKGQKKINASMHHATEQFRSQNNQFKELSAVSFNLSSYHKEKMQQLQKIQQKLEDINAKITEVSKQSENNQGSTLKASIANLQKQIKFMEQKKGILLWQLTKMKSQAKKEDFLEDNYLDQ